MLDQSRYHAPAARVFSLSTTGSTLETVTDSGEFGADVTSDFGFTTRFVLLGLGLSGISVLGRARFRATGTFPFACAGFGAAATGIFALGRLR